MVIFLKQEDGFGLVWNPLGIPFTSIKQYYWKHFEICSLTTIVVSSSVDVDISRCKSHMTDQIQIIYKSYVMAI
jgi:hypothetical protein